MPQSLEQQETRTRRGFMDSEREFETAPNARALSALRHKQIRTEIAFRHHIGISGAEHA